MPNEMVHLLLSVSVCVFLCVCLLVSVCQFVCVLCGCSYFISTKPKTCSIMQNEMGLQSLSGCMCVCVSVCVCECVYVGVCVFVSVCDLCGWSLCFRSSGKNFNS